ncbi:hypothetical protein LY78DRAFT_125121 [Colletotrichum sublineola]|nr:hypothetical protein LY78DRAFT_125121 [Colletotrichum sublineola]
MCFSIFFFFFFLLHCQYIPSSSCVSCLKAACLFVNVNHSSHGSSSCGPGCHHDGSGLDAETEAHGVLVERCEIFLFYIFHFFPNPFLCLFSPLFPALEAVSQAVFGYRLIPMFGPKRFPFTPQGILDRFAMQW